MEAIIFAHHVDKHLTSQIGEVPASMALINGKPLISYIISHLAEQEFDQVVLVVGAMRDVIEDYVGYEFHGLRVAYSEINKKSPPASALSKALNETESDEVFLIDGRTFFQVPCNQLKEALLYYKSGILMALKQDEAARIDFAVMINKKLKVVDISDSFENGLHLRFGGISVADKKFAKENSELLSVIYDDRNQETRFAEMQPLGLPLDDFFIKLSSVDEYYQAHDEFACNGIR